VARTRTAWLFGVALTLPLAVGCLERHRLGGRYDDENGGEAGAEEPAHGATGGSGSGAAAASGGAAGHASGAAGASAAGKGGSEFVLL